MKMDWPEPWPEPDAASDGGAVVPASDFIARGRERYAAALKAGSVVLWHADLSGRIIATLGWGMLTGRPESESRGRFGLDRIHPDDRPLADFRGRDIGNTLQLECRVLDANDRWRWMRARGVLIEESDGFPAEWVGIFEDIHEERLALERARYLAERDALTGLGNRRTLYEQLNRLRWMGASATVVVIDVDGFKAINDLHGHHAGDRFLLRLAQGLTACAPSHAVCARMGGDEFCAVVADQAEARALAVRLGEICGAGLAVGDSICRSGISAGIADADWQAPDPVSTVLRRADLALYHAKRNNSVLACFHPSMQAEADARQQLLHAIGAACRNDEFFLEYQPIVRVENCTIKAYEALLRWQHPQHGRIEPVLFIRLAEENGLIRELGRWVLERACDDLASAPPDIRVHVNVSARQLAEPGFADETAAILRRHGLDPGRLTLELTESQSASAVAPGPEVERLRAHGFGLVLDDFGTEYGALSQVSSGVFDGIKLSRDFIADCCAGRRAWLVLRHLVSLCDDLGMSVVAEGIETDAELSILRSAGVRLVQGFYFDRPRPLADLPEVSAAAS